MQPYFFPYIGYWQLINAVDRFVIYDDVNYIKSGWINRNRMLINGEARYFTAPLNRLSSNKSIKDTELQDSMIWRNKLIRMLEVAYGRAPYFEDVYPFLAELLKNKENNLALYLIEIIKKLVQRYKISTDLIVGSQAYNNKNLSGQQRIIDICSQEGANVYINSQGGMDLYDINIFRDSSIELKFIRPKKNIYQQLGSTFVPNLSIIDIMMFNSPEEIRSMLCQFEYIWQ